EHDRDIRLARTETSAIRHFSKDSKHLRFSKHNLLLNGNTYSVVSVAQSVSALHPNNISRDSGIEIPEAWMPTTK
ncbi:unnamed protein product, partial [Pocillopora meandrina]